MDRQCRCTRRQALKAGVAGLALAAGGAPFRALAVKPEPGAVICRVEDQALAAARLEPGAVRLCVDRAVKAFTGADEPDAAWAALFKPDDVVGIKINCIAGRGISTTPELVHAVIHGLERAGVEPNNILVWDMMDLQLMNAGFRPNKGDKGVRFVDLKWSGVEAEPRDLAGAEARLTRLLTEELTAVINMPILKDHGSAGVTFAMKNHYGSVERPSALHANGCNPYIALLNNEPEIREKTRLIVGDVTKAQFNRGPSFHPQSVWNPGQVLVGLDPVAMDTLAAGIIEDKRAAEGIPTLAAAGRPPRYIQTAAELGLGVGDPDKIRIVDA